MWKSNRKRLERAGLEHEVKTGKHGKEEERTLVHVARDDLRNNV